MQGQRRHSADIKGDVCSSTLDRFPEHIFYESDRCAKCRTTCLVWSCRHRPLCPPTGAADLAPLPTEASPEPHPTTNGQHYSRFMSKRNRSHTQTHDQNNNTNHHTKNHPPHLARIEGGAAKLRTTFHTRFVSCKTINSSHAHRTHRQRKHPGHRQTSYTNTERERETAQRRLIVEVVVAEFHVIIFVYCV